MESSAIACYALAVMVTAVCPWDEQERLVEDVFRRQLRLALENGLRRFCVFGTAGEGYAVDTARFRRVVEVFGCELLSGPAVLMVDVTGLSTANIVERLQIANDLGFRDFQISLPNGPLAPSMRSCNTSWTSAARSPTANSCIQLRPHPAHPDWHQVPLAC